jgi:hypothetical protein
MVYVEGQWHWLVATHLGRLGDHRCGCRGWSARWQAKSVSGEPNLKDALEPLNAFRATWNRGATIDDESGLTADDLDVVASFVDDVPSSD